MEIFQKFKDRFNKNDSIELASDKGIKILIKELNVLLPGDYNIFLTNFGNIYTPD